VDTAEQQLYQIESYEDRVIKNVVSGKMNLPMKFLKKVKEGDAIVYGGAGAYLKKGMKDFYVENGQIKTRSN